MSTTCPMYIPPTGGEPVPDPTEDRTFILLYPERREDGLGYDTFRAAHTRDRSGYHAWAYDPRTSSAGEYLVPSSAWAGCRISQGDWAWALSAPLGSTRQVGPPNGRRGSRGLLVVCDREAYRW